MRFEVMKRADDYAIWDNQQKRCYCPGGIVMRGTKEEMEKTVYDLNRLQSTKEKLKKKSEMAR